MEFNWFSIGKDLIDREDLDIYEKMLCIVIVRFYSEDENYELDNEILSGKMGCSKTKVEEAIKKLKNKGIIISETTKPSRIIKRESYDYIPNMEINVFQKDMAYEDKVATLYDIIEEKINEREAKIILNFAGGNIDIIKSKYNIVKKMQITDKIEALINELQKKETNKNFSGDQIDIAKLNRMKNSSYYKK